MTLMSSSHTDICTHPDERVRKLFAILNSDPGLFVPDTECARMVREADALVAAGVLAGPKGEK